MNNETAAVSPDSLPRSQIFSPVVQAGSTRKETGNSGQISIDAPPAIRSSPLPPAGAAPNDSSQEYDGSPVKRQKTSHRADHLSPPSSQENYHSAITNGDAVGILNHGEETPTSFQSRNDRPDTAGYVNTVGRPVLKPRKKGIDNKTSAPQTTETLTEKKPRPRKKREPTPDGAELIEISPTVMKMSELCKDLRTGKKSRREAEIRSQELAAQERRQKEKEGRKKSATPLNQTPEHPQHPAPENVNNVSHHSTSGPRMRIVNGEIVIDTASLKVNRRVQPSEDVEMEDVVENTLTRRINQASYGKRTKTESWDDTMTALFYRGLRMFGTDFGLISKMFRGRSRRQIKLKFNNEERKDPRRINETLLGPREPVDIATYSQLTNTTYEDPRIIQQQLDEERRRLEEQHAKEKEAQDELLRNPIGLANDPDILPSIEHDDNRGVSSSNDKPPTVKSMSRSEGWK